MKYDIDLRSDTVTKPTEAMRKAMQNAIVGDDVYQDDLTTNELERYAAHLVGKEAALFVPSGTFANQLALLTHCQKGDEVILADDCHIVAHEAGASAVIAGVQLRTIVADGGDIPVAEVDKRIRRGGDIHYPNTALICLENAHSSGRVIPLSSMRTLYELAQSENIPVHVDGARVFNAAVALGVSVAEIAQYTDSLMFCLSKGLCAPVGSIIAGSQIFIDRARKGRKIMGGGMRQTGVLAAPGLLALRDMPRRLSEDHDNAKYLGSELAKIEGIRVLSDHIQINMVFFALANTACTDKQLAEEFSEIGIKINMADDGLMRFVTHHGITKDDIDAVIYEMKTRLV